MHEHVDLSPQPVESMLRSPGSYLQNSDGLNQINSNQAEQTGFFQFDEAIVAIRSEENNRIMLQENAQV